jgi:endonuclease III
MGFAPVFTVWVAENCSSSRSETMAKIEYRRLAATCIRLAEQTTDPKTAKALRELAEEYQTKANSIEKAEKRG